MSANVLIEKRELFLKGGDQLIISGKGSYRIENIKKIIFNGEKGKSVIKGVFFERQNINHFQNLTLLILIKNVLIRV